MDDILKEALEIVKAQASVRTMTEEEITSMVRRIAESVRMAAGFEIETPSSVLANGASGVKGDDSLKAIKEKNILCLESGKPFKILTKRHLAKFGLTPEQYREKWGYPKNMPLVCKALQRERRKKMKEMKLWEKRRVEVASRA